jgi:PAS domain S-box-containing protein
VTEEPNSPDIKTKRQRLYELMDDAEVSLAEKQRRALALGREYLGVTNGNIQRRNSDNTDTVVVTVGENPALFPEGSVLDRSTTYCRRTVESQSPVALSNVPEQGWDDDSAYRKHGFECYLGTPIFTRGEAYGTVCFMSAAPREMDFTADEKAFVELIARLLGRALEAAEYEQRVENRSRAQRHSEQKYEALLQLAPDAIFVVDAETGTIETANGRAASLSGYTADELHGMSILDIHPEADRERYLELLEHGFDEQIQERFDDGTPLVLTRSDGTEIPIELGASRVELDDHEVVLGIVRDISERRERERELTRSREFLRQIQEAVDLGGWEIDLDSGSGRWTDEVYRIFGLPVDTDLTVEEAIQLYHPEDRPRLTEAFERLTTEGEPYDLELRIQTADEEVRWVRTVGRPQYEGSDGGDNGPSSVLGIIRDITERKERERDLRIKDQAIEESTVGITIGDANRSDTPIVYANAGFEELTGYAKEQVMGENCRFLQGQNTDDATVDEIRAAIDSKEEIQTEILNYRRNGTPFWNELTISPIMGAESREVTHFVGIQTDVTAQKRRARLIEVLDRVLRHNLRNEYVFSPS